MKAYLIAAAAAVLIGGGIWYTVEQRNIGGSAERQKQVEENARFTVKANKGVVGLDTCDDAGGVYDFAKATCQLK